LVSSKLKAKRDQRTQVSHIEVRELRQLAQLDRQPFELIVVELKRTLGSDHDPLNSISYAERPELCQLADWQRRELVVIDLNESSWVRSRSICLDAAR
jgi:hypothetical protein